MSAKRLFTLGLFRRARARTEMREELAFHIEERIAWLIARGANPAEARAEAARRFGASDIESITHRLGESAERKERKLDMRSRLSDFVDDVRFAVRGLVRSPGFAAIAILTLAIGIGANAAIYSALDALLLRALPFREPATLTDIVQTTDAGGEAYWSYPRFDFYRRAQSSHSAVAAHAIRARILTGADPERVTTEEVTGEYLKVLGVRPQAGGDFPSNVDAAPGGAARYALISDALWQRRFGADPGVIGQSLGVDNAPHEIIGVLAPGFRGLSGRADVLINLTARTPDVLAQAWSLEFSMVGRLAPGITPGAAAAEARMIGARIHEAFPPQQGTLSTSAAPEKWSADARSLNTIRVAGGIRRSLIVLFAAVSLVLLIACANLANLLLARGVARRREIAVRLAMGARRGRLVRLLVTESLVLAFAGGAAAIGVAVAGTRFLSSINPQEALQAQGLQGGIGAVGFENIQLDGRALAFTFAVTLFVGLLFGVVPAFRAARADPNRDLRDGTAGAGSRVGVTRHALVVAEVTLAIVLLAGSGLMIRSLSNLMNVDTGFDGSNTLTARLTIPPGGMAPDSMPGFYDELQRRVRALPGVNEVALADCPPLSGGCNGTIMTFADRPATATGNAMVGVHWVSSNWFRTLRVPLVRGRMFDDGDRLGGPKVVLINEAAAKRYFPGEDPIGKRVAVYQGGFHTGAEVIGIVGDVRFGTIDSTARPDAYIAYSQSRVPRMMLFVRTSGDPLALVGALRDVVRRFSPGTPVFDVRTMEARTAAATAQTRLSAVLLALFAGVALALAALGIYGVTSFAVAQRTREIGIRVALGADRRRVLGLVLRQSTLIGAIGIGLGVAAALASTRVLRTMLFGVTPSDPGTYVVIALVPALVLFVASLVPARRAAAVDPMVALRRE